MNNQKDKRSRTLVGDVELDALAYTAGGDIELDRRLVNADCIGTAAHVTMLSGLPLRPKLFTLIQRKAIISELVRVMRSHKRGTFRISLKDQDVHLAVERALTARLGDIAKTVHTARSRNDQIALDLRLFGKEQMLDVMDAALELATSLAFMAKKYKSLPMPGRTHLRPAMPSSVGLWSYAYAEGLMDDLALVRCAYELNDQCPLGSAAGYGVPLQIDRQKTSDLLGFRRPVHSVLHAANTRGKLESAILASLAQVMITISRMAHDLIIYSMPEFEYFELPGGMGTGSSIMPQKNNPDILELVRARSSKVASYAFLITDIVRSLPGGYSRDLQETKEPFIYGLDLVKSSLRILGPYMKRVVPNKAALLAGFRPELFAADLALELAVKGTPFREAYFKVKKLLATGADIGAMAPEEALSRRSHLGASAGLDFGLIDERLKSKRGFVTGERKRFYNAISRLLGVPYPF